MFSFLKRKKQCSPSSEMSRSARQRDWDRKIERETYEARAEDREAEKTIPTVQYKKSPVAVQKRSSSVEGRPLDKKLKSAARKGGKFLVRMTKDVGAAGTVAGKGIYKGAKKTADVLETWANNTVREENRTGWGVGSPVRTARKAPKKVVVRKAPKKVAVKKAPTKAIMKKITLKKKPTAVKRKPARIQTAKRRPAKRRAKKIPKISSWYSG